MAYYKSAQKLRRDNALSEITSNATLKAQALTNLGLADVAGVGIEVASGKTLAVSNSLTLAGTDGTTMTFPSTSGSIATLGGAQIFTGAKTIGSGTSLTVAGLFQVTSIASRAMNLGGGTVSQATNVNTDVTVNAASGVITTQSASTAAQAYEAGFTVTNSTVAAASVVLARIADYSGTLSTNGIPDVKVDTIASGSFHIRVGNIHATNALSGTMKIHFIVV